VLPSSLHFASKYSRLLLSARDGGPVVLTDVGNSTSSVSVSADNEILYSLEPKFPHLTHKSTPQDPVLNEFNPICTFAGWFGAVIALLSSQYPIYDTKVFEGVLDFTKHYALIRTLSI